MFSRTLAAIWTFDFLPPPSWICLLVWTAFSVFDLYLPYYPVSHLILYENIEVESAFGSFSAFLLLKS